MIVPDLKVFFRKSGKAKTWPNVTLGEFDHKKRHIDIFLEVIKEKAEIYASKNKLSINKVFLDLMVLVFFHELHHAMFTNDSTEALADAFAIKAFKVAFKRAAILEKDFADI